MTSIYNVNRNTIKDYVPIFTKIIFDNFIELKQYPYVRHTHNDIQKLLSSEQLFGYIVKYNDTIIAYMFGEVTTLSDGRNVFYLSYIYVVPKYRHIKTGSLLLRKLIAHCRQFGIPFIVLTCDTENEKVMAFYKKFGFVNDPILTSDRKHDVLCLFL